MSFIPVKNKKRILVMFVIISLLSLYLIFRLVYIQVVKSEYYKEKAYAQQTREREIKARRGTIYDASGEKVFAQSISTNKINITPMSVDNKDEVGKKLSEITGIDLDKIMNKLNKKSSIETIYSKLDSKKEEELLKYISDNNIQGIKVDEDVIRYYPYSTLLSQTIGFTGTDNQGLAGIEAMYEDELSGVSGKIVGATDEKGRETPFTNEQFVDPIPGKDLVLTVDATIQSIVEKHLQKSYEENNASYATCIVMRPKTGEVLAIANAPNFDLNNPFEPNTEEFRNNYDKMSSKERKDALEQMWRNRVVADTQEPGSSFKIVTASAILEENIVGLDDPNMFYCNGYENVLDWKIKCWRYPRTHGSESLRQGIMNSCNPVFMQGSSRMGIDAYCKYLEAFNLYSRTGVDLPAEATGIMHKKENMTAVDLATTSFGQTIQISTIQTAVNYCAIANGGYLVKPYVVKEIKNTDGTFSEKKESQVLKQILSKKTADDVLSALESTVSEGTGKAARVSGYRVGGKTATAEIGRGENKKYMAGFAGVAPVNNPELVVIMNIMDPKGPLGHQGSRICAPVVGSIIDETLRYLDINPEYVIEENNIKEKIIPNLIGMTFLEASNTLIQKGFKISFDEKLNDNDKIVDQIPKEGASLMEGSSVRVYANDNKKQTVTLADLRNKTSKQAINILKKLDLNARIIGNGYVLTQEPGEGSILDKGSIVIIKCTDTLDLP